MAKRHFGHIADIRVGKLFNTRRELHDAGIHTGLQAGISWEPGGCADSVIVSGGYEDDRDAGEVILYTGHGGRDATTGRQVRNQAFTEGNEALQKNMLQRVPVRVTRGADLRSAFAPSAGYRYDGLYEVTNCWIETGVSGFGVCRFLLERFPGQPVAWNASNSSEHQVLRSLAKSSKAQYEGDAITPIGDLCGREDFPACALNQLVRIKDVVGIVVALEGRGEKFQLRDRATGKIRTFLTQYVRNNAAR